MITVLPTRKIMTLRTGFAALNQWQQRRRARFSISCSSFPMSYRPLQYLTDTFGLNTADRLRLEWLRLTHRSPALHPSLNSDRVHTRR